MRKLREAAYAQAMAGFEDLLGHLRVYRDSLGFEARRSVQSIVWELREIREELKQVREEESGEAEP